MSAFDFVFALLLAAVSVVLAGLLLRVLVQSFTGDLRGMLYRMRLKRKQKLLADADAALGRGDRAGARIALRGAFFIGGEFESFGFVERVQSHNLDVFDRVLDLASEKAKHDGNLPLLEGLFQSRHELLRSLLDAIQAQRALTSRRKEKGKEAPEWALGEYQRKVAELRERLEANRKSLAAQLAHLFAGGDGPESQSEITFH